MTETETELRDRYIAAHAAYHAACGEASRLRADMVTAMRELRDAGMSGAAIGAAVTPRITKQRVGQLLND